MNLLSQALHQALRSVLRRTGCRSGLRMRRVGHAAGRRGDRRGWIAIGLGAAWSRAGSCMRARRRAAAAEVLDSSSAQPSARGLFARGFAIR